MKTVGIIAEYNPFHTGHKYHIQKAKEVTGADYAVVVMSPDFVQRGEPAVFDKYVRTRMALISGADLVLQLPVCYATGSAEYFAQGAVSLLDSIGITDCLCFGGESDNVSLFQSVAEVLNQEPEEYSLRLKELLRLGYTYPKARCEALAGHFADKSVSSIAGFLSTPNNILGIEYCRALQKRNSSILPVPVSRIGSQYNSVSLTGQYASATAIRTGLMQESGSEQLLPYIPDECQDIFLSASNAPITIYDFSLLLSQKLIYENDFSSVFDISTDLSDRIITFRNRCIGCSFEDVVSMLKTKQMTEARIRRALLHLLLDISSKSAEMYRKAGTVFYARILGFRKTASPLLHELKLHSSVPVISKNAAAESLLLKPEAPESALAIDMWKQDLQSAHLYHAIAASKYQIPFHTEYEKSPIVI